MSLLRLTATAATRSIASARPVAATAARALSSASHTNSPPSPDLTPDQVGFLGGVVVASRLPPHLLPEA